jgi:hypothetical protein
MNTGKTRAERELTPGLGGLELAPVIETLCIRADATDLEWLGAAFAFHETALKGGLLAARTVGYVKHETPFFHGFW